MKILVLDGNENQAVACVRSLARARHQVYVGATSTWSKAGWSSSCAGTFTYPDPGGDADAFANTIIDRVRRDTGALVLPMTERTTLPLSARRTDVFTAGGRMVLPEHSTIQRAFDKLAITRLAQSLGVEVPQTTLVGNRCDAHAAASSVRYPTVLKPRTSEEVSADGRLRATGAPMYASDPRQFMAAYDELSRRCHLVLVQEFVQGKGAGYFALMRHGELRAEFAHQRIREMRPTGSGSSLRVSVRPEPRVRSAGLAILQALGWHGVAMVEFRLRSDGTPVLLEVNGRFWVSLPLAVCAGVDFPALLAEMVERGDVEGPSSYRIGVRCRWLVGDLVHLVDVLKGRPKGYPGEFPGRIRTLLNFLVPVRGTYHDNFALSDPLPEVGDWLHFILHRLPMAGKRLLGSRRLTTGEVAPRPNPGKAEAGAADSTRRMQC